MASSSTRITVVERCTVAPPPRSVAATSLPLTFFDVPWLLFTPSQPLFFYNLPTSTAQFRQTILPNLKHSLSLTLQHFYTLAGKLLTPPISAEPTIEYNEGDSITLTVSEAAGDDDQIFKNLAGDHPRTARDFEGLVPMLGLDDDNDVSIGQPILAIQVTVFPGCGICVGFALRHVAADERTFNNFLKTWASLVGGVWGIDKSVASHDREGIRDHVGLKSTLLKHWWDVKHLHKEGSRVNGSSCNDVLRATFVLGPKEMEKIKNWILARSEMLFGSTQLLLSPYVLTCAFVWVCWVKAHWSGEDRGELKSVHYFGFVAGGLTRLSYMVPRTYVGNCVGFGRARALRNELIGENGIAFAAKAIGDTVKKLNKCFLNDAEHWISEWEELRESEFHVTVTGSPKVDLYELDFGWGRPVKIEQASIETTRAISLCQGREVKGFTPPFVDDGLLEVVGFTDAWQGLVLLAPKGHGTRLAQAHRIQFESHKGGAYHTYMRIDGEPWKQPLPVDDDTVKVEISHLGQVKMLATRDCISKSCLDPSSPSAQNDNDSDDDDESIGHEQRKFGAADTFKIPDEVDIAQLS